MKKNFKYLFLILIGCGIFVGCSDEDLDPTLQQSKVIEESVSTINDLQVILRESCLRLR